LALQARAAAAEFLAQAIGAGCQPSRRETESSRRGRGDGQLS
jgi:hypothetical protein